MFRIFNQNIMFQFFYLYKQTAKVKLNGDNIVDNAGGQLKLSKLTEEVRHSLTPITPQMVIF